MLTQFSSVSKNINRSPYDQLDIASFSCHERYQSAQALTGHRMWFLPSQERHKWSENYSPIPPNIKFLTEIKYGQAQCFDMILSHTPQQTSGIANQIAKQFNLPHISLNHCLLLAINPNYSSGFKKEIVANDPSDYRVWITSAQMADWGYKDDPKSRVILHGFDDKFWCGYNPKQSSILVVANDLIGRGAVMGWDICQEVLDNKPVIFVGDTLWPNGKRFSEPAKNINELLIHYQSNMVYFNSARISTISSSTLEALMVGCPVVSCEAPSFRDYFNCDGEHLFMSNDTNKLRSFIDFLMSNPKEAYDMGQRGRLKCTEIFNMNRFLNDWNKLFTEVLNNHINFKQTTIKGFFNG